ncbi:MAG: hypothetical protein HYT19_01405 [Candidatus Nealsonbacteria bacterium]|nr:hypothetical protein [Candidatus Nealsonbacteria bacterium]
MDVKELINLIVYPPFGRWLLILEILFLALTLLFIGVIIFTLIKSSWLKYYILYDAQEFIRHRPFGTKKVDRDWNKIKARLDTGLESEYKLSILEADSMMDDVLKRMGFGGASLGERLDKLTEVSLANLNRVRLAHQTRPNVVHHSDYKPSLDEAQQTIAIFEESLIDLQVL